MAPAVRAKVAVEVVGRVAAGGVGRAALGWAVTVAPGWAASVVRGWEAVEALERVAPEVAAGLGSALVAAAALVRVKGAVLGKEALAGGEVQGLAARVRVGQVAPEILVSVALMDAGTAARVVPGAQVRAVLATQARAALVGLGTVEAAE